MAANLAGMFSQINNAIQGNPTADVFGGLMGDVSQQGAGMLSNAMGMPERSMDFMNKEGQQQQQQQNMRAAQKEISEQDLSTVKGLAAAAQAAAKAGDVETARKFAAEARQLKQAIQTRKTTNKHVGTSNTTLEDEAGNLYKPITTTDRVSGETNVQYIPLTPGAPATPMGKPRIVSGSSGLSGAEQHLNRVELADVQHHMAMTEDEYQHRLDKGLVDHKTAKAVEEKKNIEWNTEKGEIMMAVPDLMMQKDKVNEALTMLETTETGGARSQIAGLLNYFNLSDTTSEAQLNKIMSDYVLQNLRSMGANPTEGERAFLIESAENMKRGTKANIAMFKDTLARLEKNIEAKRALHDNPDWTREQYVGNFANMIEEKREEADSGLSSEAKGYFE